MGKRIRLDPHGRGPHAWKGIWMPFWHPEMKGKVLVHGDDFMSVGGEAEVKHLADTLSGKHEAKV